MVSDSLEHDLSQSYLDGPRCQPLLLHGKCLKALTHDWWEIAAIDKENSELQECGWKEGIISRSINHFSLALSQLVRLWVFCFYPPHPQFLQLIRTLYLTGPGESLLMNPQDFVTEYSCSHPEHLLPKRMLLVQITIMHMSRSRMLPLPLFWDSWIGFSKSWFSFRPAFGLILKVR